MTNLLEQVSHVAVWGSLIGSVILGTYLAVQAVLIKERRSKFALFALVCGINAAIDFLHAHFSYFDYEKMRIVGWSAYGATLLWLFNYSLRSAFLSFIIPQIVALAAWHWINPALATTAVVPVAFAIAAIVHGKEYLRSNGFGSCVLSVYSFALALLCSCYYLFLLTQNSEVIGLGYLHYALLSCTSVGFGWIQLTREIRGRLPVRVPLSIAQWFGGVVLISEVGLILSVLVFFSWPPILYLLLSLLQVIAVSGLFFYYRHQLVIYTDNVSELLEKRTTSLREAQRELAGKNEQQAVLLASQAKEIRNKAEIIERQRRLELAAQTAGQAAHDIQNLISPMLIHLGSLERRELDSGTIRGVIATVRKQADELLELNGQLLALARRGRTDHSPVNLTELVSDLLARFPERRIRCDLDESIWILGAWSQVSRAVHNLICNAVDAIDGLEASRQEVSVKVTSVSESEMRKCHLGFLSPGRYAAVSVIDRGTGIPHEYIERIFEPFFSSKSTRERSGSGLGLSIVSAVIDDHKGVIDLITGTKGTEFHVYIPLIEAPSDVVRLDMFNGTETILIIDDDLTILESYRTLLERFGYNVITVGSGDEGLRVLQLEEVNLILLDLSMPIRNGYETLYAAIHIRPGVRAIIHSSYVAEQERVRLAQLGVEYFLQKPASRNEVLQRVRSVLDFKPSQKVVGV